MYVLHGVYCLFVNLVCVPVSLMLVVELHYVITPPCAVPPELQYAILVQRW